MGFDYDRTKGNIGADDLDTKDRKDLLDKFKDSGGQIIKEFDSTAAGSAKKGSAGGKGTLSRPSKVKMPSEIAREEARLESEKVALRRQAEKEAEKSISNFFSKIKLQLKCSFGGVSNYGSANAKAKIIRQIIENGRRAAMEFNILGSDLFHSDPKIAKTIQKELDKENFLYMELLERGHEIYNSHNFESISEAYHSSGDGNVELRFIRDPIAKIYGELYYFYNFWIGMK